MKICFQLNILHGQLSFAAQRLERQGIVLMSMGAHLIRTNEGGVMTLRHYLLAVAEHSLMHGGHYLGILSRTHSYLPLSK